MSRKRTIITIHKLIEQNEIDLVELVKKDLFHEDESVVISALGVLAKIGASDMQVQLRSLFDNSTEKVRIKVLDFIKSNPEPEHVELLENLFSNDLPNAIQLRVIRAMGAVAKIFPDLLQFIRIRAGYEESRLDIRSQAIEALGEAEDYEYLMKLWAEYCQVEEDEPFACQVLACFKGVKDEEMFSVLYGHQRHLKDPLGLLSIALHEAMLNLYTPGVKSQSQYTRISENLTTMCRSSDDREQSFVLKVLHGLAEGHESIVIKLISALLISANNNPDLKAQRRKLIARKTVQLCTCNENRKNLSNTFERLILNSSKVLNSALSNYSLKIGENPRADFIEFFESVGNFNLLSVVIQYLKINPIEEQRRNLIVSILKKIKPNLNSRQLGLLTSVLKLLMSEDIRIRSGLAIECGKIRFEESLANLTENLNFLVSTAADVFGDRCEKILLPLYEPISGLNDIALKINLLKALVRNGGSVSFEFVLNQRYDFDAGRNLQIFAEAPQSIASHQIDFLKKKFDNKKTFSEDFLEIVVMLIERLDELRDSEWVRILFQIQQLKYGYVSDKVLSRIRARLLASGSSAALDTLHHDLKTKNYVLNSQYIGFILNAYEGFLLDENEYNREILVDLLFGCLKDENSIFMADLGYVLHGAEENQGSLILQQCIDSSNPDVVAKAIQYFRKSDLHTNWQSLFKVLGNESFKVHQQFLLYFAEFESKIGDSELKNELFFQITGQRLVEETVAESKVSEEQIQKMEELFDQMRSSKMDNKLRFQMEQNLQELTIFFIDIAGYTKRSQESDISDIMLLLDNFSKIIQPIGERFNGNLIKKIGDCFMYTFLEPLEGVLASLEIQSQLQIYNEKRAESEQLHTRIGLNTGKVFVRDDDVFGDPVNLASRIESQAPHDGILVSETTFQEIENFVEFQKMDLITVKGVVQPIQTYLILDCLPGVLETFRKRSLEDS